MENSPAFEFPEIGDQDLHWAATQLGLPESAFLGEQGNDPRKAVIQSKTNLDVAACPGSGKTTVLIAKLAILSRKWKHRTRGVCVLSHTNAARNIIETHLGNSSEGRRLLSYPHFVGTIHSFVNEFLAIPWLRAQGYPIKLIDTDVCEKRRWGKLGRFRQEKMSRKYMSEGSLKLVNTDFDFEKKKGAFPYRNDTSLCEAVKASFQKTALEGYYCYDDMFVWARDMLARSQSIRSSIRQRFPLLFVDEAQDNSAEQAELLKDIFTADGVDLIRQRFGDGNQAIYDFTGAQGATTDAFPNDSKVQIPDSFRFGQSIANLADPLGLAPYAMVGLGPKLKTLASGTSECCHTIFVFDDNSIEQVLGSYGKLLLDTFSENEVQQGTFAAIGMVHKRRDDDDVSKCFPHSVSDYWKNYNSELSRMDPAPQTFIEYVYAGIAASREANESYRAIEKIAQGIFRLAAIAEKPNESAGHKHKHRLIVETLSGTSELKMLYLEFLVSFVVKQEDLSEEVWKSKWQSIICGIAEKICGLSLTGTEVESFLSWGIVSAGSIASPAPKSRTGNVYIYARDDREVPIKVGSIHSVKGQTHTATLVLETAWNGCNLENIMPWLSGDAVGKHTDSGVREITRLKTHYVAMTRPSHLLCLALNKKALCDGNGQIESNLTNKLRGRGWRIVDVATGVDV